MQNPEAVAWLEAQIPYGEQPPRAFQLAEQMVDVLTTEGGYIDVSTAVRDAGDDARIRAAADTLEPCSITVNIIAVDRASEPLMSVYETLVAAYERWTFAEDYVIGEEE